MQSLLPLAARLEGAQAAGAAREMSQYFNAPNGPAVKQVAIEDEWYNRQRNLFPILREHPYFPLDVYIAPNAVVCGDVDLYGKVSSCPTTRARLCQPRLRPVREARCWLRGLKRSRGQHPHTVCIARCRLRCAECNSLAATALCSPPSSSAPL